MAFFSHLRSQVCISSSNVYERKCVSAEKERERKGKVRGSQSHSATVSGL